MTDTDKGLDLRLETAAGDAYVRSKAIVYISAPYKKPKYPESRTIALEGGHRIFCLNSVANIEALRASGVGDKIPPPEPAPSSRTKARKQRAQRQEDRPAGDPE